MRGEAEAFDHIGSVWLDGATSYLSILEAARKIARERWGEPTQSGYGTMCAVLCIAAVRPSTEHQRATLYRYFGEANDVHLCAPGMPRGRAYGRVISVWNDKPERTKTEVVRAFTKTIRYVKANDYDIPKPTGRKTSPTIHSVTGFKK